MKNIIAIIFLFFSSLIFSQNDLTSIPGKYVYDYANILNDQDEIGLNKKLIDYEKKTSIEMAVVTVSSLNGRDIEGFSIDLAKRWGIGKKQNNTGLLLLIAPNEKKWRFEIGYGLEPYFTDIQSKRIGEKHFKEHFRKKEYFKGIDLAMNDVITSLGDQSLEVRKEFLQAKQKEEIKQKEELADSFLTALFIFLFIIGIILIGVVIFKWVEKKKKQKALLNEQKYIFNQTFLQYSEKTAFISKLIENNPKFTSEDNKNLLKDLTLDKFYAVDNPVAATEDLKENFKKLQKIEKEILNKKSIYDEAINYENDVKKEKLKLKTNDIVKCYNKILNKFPKYKIGIKPDEIIEKANNSLNDLEKIALEIKNNLNDLNFEKLYPKIEKYNSILEEYIYNYSYYSQILTDLEYKKEQVASKKQEIENKFDKLIVSKLTASSSTKLQQAKDKFRNLKDKNEDDDNLLSELSAILLMIGSLSYISSISSSSKKSNNNYSSSSKKSNNYSSNYSSDSYSSYGSSSWGSGGSSSDSGSSFGGGDFGGGGSSGDW